MLITGQADIGVENHVNLRCSRPFYLGLALSETGLIDCGALALLVEKDRDGKLLRLKLVVEAELIVVSLFLAEHFPYFDVVMSETAALRVHYLAGPVE